jgi:FKBP-type peptidyl-prolyl cis-trans isomerase FkpA
MSVTAVPIRPVRKGVLLTLWVGVGLAVAAAAGAAWYGTSSPELANAATPEQFMAWNAKQEGVTTTASGLQYQVLHAGNGGSPTDSDAVLVGYKGTLRDGKVFDENPQASFPVAGVVPGFSEGLKLMKRGGKYRLWIPPALGYGEQPQGDVIPGNSLLIFDVELIDYKSIAEIQAEMERLRQQGALPSQQGQGGMPPGAMPPGGMPPGAQ